MVNEFNEIRAALLEIMPHCANFIFTESWPVPVKAYPLVIEYRGHRGFPKEVGNSLERIAKHHSDISFELCEETFVTLAFRSKEKRDLWKSFFSEIVKKEEIRSAIVKDRNATHHILGKYMLP